MTNINYEDFQKLDLRIAKIVDVEEIEGADKLWKLTLDVGDEEEGGLGMRTICAGIKQVYSPEDLKGKLVPYLANLEPKVLRGVESQGMLIATGDEEAVLIHPDKDVSPGSKLR